MSELTIESWKRDNKKIKREKHYSQWYWGDDHLGNKVKNIYFGPKLDWMKLFTKRKKKKK